MKKVLGVLLLLVGALGESEPIEAAKFSGRLLKMTAATKADSQALSVAGKWKTVPGMFVDFTTTKNGPAVATFCASVSTSDFDGQLFVRVWEAGAGNWEPGWTEFDTKEFFFKTRCFSWFATLPAGSRRIRVQYLGTNPDSGFVNERSLRVQHEN